MLSQSEDQTLRAKNGILNKEDFLILVNIIENRLKVFFSEEKENMMKKRMDVLKDKGLDSPEYLACLIKDVCGLINMEEDPTNEVLKVANVSTLCLEASMQEHVGDENTIN